jgi:PST family polysaccharide transporter
MSKTQDWRSLFIHENLWGYMSQIVTLVAGFAITLIFPKILGPHDFGLFAMAFAAASFCLYFADFGITFAVSRFAAAHRLDAGAYFFAYLPHKIGLAFLVSGILFALAPSIATHIFNSPATADGIRASSLFIFGYTLFFYADFFISSIFKNKYSFFANLIYNLLRVALPIFLFFFVYRSYSSILLGISLAMIIAAAAAAYGIYRLRIKNTGTVNGAAFNYFLKFSAIMAFGAMLICWIDSLVLSVFIKPEELGFYRLAASWVAAIVMLIPFSSRVLTTSFAESHARGDIEQSARLFFSAIKYTTAFVFLFILGILLLADKFVVFIYGNAFSGTADFFRIFSFLLLETGLNTIALTYILARGSARFHAYMLLILGLMQFLVSLGFSLLHIGPIWVAVAITGIRVIASLFIIKLVARKLGVSGLGVFLRAPAVALALYFAFSFLISPLVSSKIHAFAYAVLITIAYFALIFATGALEWRSFVSIVRKTMRIGGA